MHKFSKGRMMMKVTNRYKHEEKILVLKMGVFRHFQFMNNLCNAKNNGFVSFEVVRLKKPVFEFKASHAFT